MEPGKLDITIRKGERFTLSLVYQDNTGTPIDITGYTAKAQIRKSVESDAVYAEMSTVNGKIVITGASGQIDISIPSADTSAMKWSGTAKWDLKITSADLTTDFFLLQGDATLETMVTQ